MSGTEIDIIESGATHPAIAALADPAIRDHGARGAQHACAEINAAGENGHDSIQIALDVARTQLKTILDPTEIKRLLDHALTIELGLKHRGASMDVRNDAAEITLRYERALVALLAPIVRAGNPNCRKDPTIGRLPVGIDRRQFYRWKQVARVEESTFQDYLDAARGAGDEIGTVGLLRFAGVTIDRRRLDDAEAIVATAPVPTDRECPTCRYRWRSTSDECDRCIECPTCKHLWIKSQGGVK